MTISLVFADLQALIGPAQPVIYRKSGSVIVRCNFVFQPGVVYEVTDNPTVTNFTNYFTVNREVGEVTNP